MPVRIRKEIQTLPRAAWVKAAPIAPYSNRFPVLVAPFCYEQMVNGWDGKWEWRMSRAKEVGTAVGTLACALSIGFAMQSTETASLRYGAGVIKKDPELSKLLDNKQGAIFGSQFMDVREITLTSALGSKQYTRKVEPVQVVTSSNAFEESNPARAQPVAPHDGCSVNARATTLKAAFVRLSMEAPCRADEVVTIHHNGMMFTAFTDADGALSIKVPALAKSAVFIFGFEDGDGAVAHAVVDDITSYRRVVLQWRDRAGFQLHAREFGADYGEDGHVWRESRATLARVVNGEGGYMTSLGGDSAASPYSAEVYSFPAQLAGRHGEVDLSIEAIVSEANCGSNIEAQTFEWDGVSQLRSKNVSLEMPTCDAVGEYLVLNNILDDLKVASK